MIWIVQIELENPVGVGADGDVVVWEGADRVRRALLIFSAKSR
mgnify:CR=1 FL=1